MNECSCCKFKKQKLGSDKILKETKKINPPFKRCPPNSKPRKICPECKSSDISFEGSEIFCEKCGLILATAPPLYVKGRAIIVDWGLIYK